MFKYNLINKVKLKINKKSIDTILLNISNIVKKEQNGTINIVFLDDNSIKNLNKKYRNIDKSTDVLSFHYYDDFKNLKQKDIAGEIIISEDKIFSQAKEYGITPLEEFYKLLIHSLLHILGYDHEIKNDYKIMNQFENQIYKEVFEK